MLSMKTLDRFPVRISTLISSLCWYPLIVHVGWHVCIKQHSRRFYPFSSAKKKCLLHHGLLFTSNMAWQNTRNRTSTQRAMFANINTNLSSATVPRRRKIFRLLVGDVHGRDIRLLFLRVPPFKICLFCCLLLTPQTSIPSGIFAFHLLTPPRGRCRWQFY